MWIDGKLPLLFSPFDVDTKDCKSFYNSNPVKVKAQAEPALAKATGAALVKSLRQKSHRNSKSVGEVISKTVVHNLGRSESPSETLMHTMDALSRKMQIQILNMISGGS